VGGKPEGGKKKTFKKIQRGGGQGKREAEGATTPKIKKEHKKTRLRKEGKELVGRPLVAE